MVVNFHSKIAFKHFFEYECVLGAMKNIVTHLMRKKPEKLLFGLFRFLRLNYFQGALLADALKRDNAKSWVCKMVIFAT